MSYNNNKPYVEPASEKSYANYLQHVDNLNPASKHNYLRIDYKEISQSWPDYLDYVEEWKDIFYRKVPQIRRDFIYHALAKHRQRLPCGNHYHTFTTEDNTGQEYVSIPDRDSFINEASCWYQSLSAAEDRIIADPISVNSAILSHVQHIQLKKITGLHMVFNKDDTTTHKLLDYEQYQQEWKDKETTSKAIKIMNESFVEPIPPTKLSDIKTGFSKPNSTENPHTWFVPGTTDVIAPNEDIIRDHGFHNLLRVRKDRKYILKLINRIRSPYTTKIHHKEIQQAMEGCNECKYVNPDSTTTMPGIYYSPPGNGKTTAQKLDIFIGIDTDWLLKHSDFQHMCLPFLKLGIPILTNQYLISTDSPYKVFGAYSKNHLRYFINSNNCKQPYTQPSEIYNAMLANHGDIVILYTSDYFTNRLIDLLYLQFIQNTTFQFVYGYNRVKQKHKIHYDFTIPINFN